MRDRGQMVRSLSQKGQLDWQVDLPNGPQLNATLFVLSDDQAKIYYIG